MAICPHCRENAIGVHSKAWSSASHPVKCRRCGGLSHIAHTRAAGLFATYEGLFFLGALMALVIFAPLWVIPALMVWFIGIIAYEAFLFYRAPMIAVTE